MSEALIFSNLSRSQRLVWGIIILLAVDVIWVASSELTEYVFKVQDYEKPFFSTFLKMSLFMTYLPGFCLYAPWRNRCSTRRGFKRRKRRSSPSESSSRQYSALNSAEDELDEGEEEEEEEEDDGVGEIRDEDDNSLSHPVFLPVNHHSTDESESENLSSLNGTKKKSVRFSRLAEIRQMSAADALHANIARLSYQASIRAQAALRRAASRLTVKEVALLALTFSFPFFLGNYCYQMALKNTEAGIVNVLSSSSSLFTLLLGALFPSNAESDRFTLSKFIAVCFSIVGVVLVSFSDIRHEVSYFPFGSLWALGGSLFYSLYIVLLRRKVDHEDKLDVPMFFGFVGFFIFIFMWPLFIILHFSGNETFVWPTGQQLLFLAINGIVGTVISELLWLWGCFLTSSLVATISMGLNIPFSMVADILVKKVEYGPLFYIGSFPMFLSFFLVTILTHYSDWDPILDFLKLIMRKTCRNRRSPNSGPYVFDRQERESLINQEECGHTATEDGSNAQDE